MTELCTGCVPDEVVHNIFGMYVNSDESREGAAVQVRQGPPDQAGKPPQLGSACQQVLSQGSRRAGCAQALLYPGTPVYLHRFCLSTGKHWLESSAYLCS